MMVRFSRLLLPTSLLLWAPAAPLAAADPDIAYYCGAAQAYYPTVTSCRGSWTPVPRRPPEADPRRSPTPAEPQPALASAAPAASADSDAAVAGSVALIVFGPQQHAIQCATGQICDLALQPGEHVDLIKLGDAGGWSVEQAVQGSGASAVEHVFLSPHSRGLDTSMVLLTARRSYHFRVSSPGRDYMAHISFTYPDETLAAVAQRPAAAAMPVDTQTPTADAAPVDGITYVKGREPRPLGASHAAAAPSITPPYSASGAILSFQDPLFASPLDLPLPPPPLAAPRPSVDIGQLH